MVVLAVVRNFTWTEAETEEKSGTKVKFQFKGKKIENCWEIWLILFKEGTNGGKIITSPTYLFQ